MDIASAYPNSDLSALSMTVIAVIVAGTLAAWLILVFLADRQPRSHVPEADQAETEAAQAGSPGLTDNDHNELDESHPAEHRGVAAR
jgi:hypothetical protein